MNISKKLIIVADAKQAKFFVANGLKIKEHRRTLNADDLQIGHERNELKNGFYQKGPSTPSHFFDPRSDAKQLERGEFCKEVISKAEDYHSQDKFDEFIIIAEPKTLGEIRSQLNNKLLNLVSKEVARDLVHATTEEVEAHAFS